MATYLLDTSVIIDVLNGKRDRKAFLEELVRRGGLLACCAINIAEVFAGMRPQQAESTEELLASLEYYDITREVAKKAGEIKSREAHRGRTLSIPDTIIAAVAMSNDLTLITDNVKDYPTPGLQLYPLR